MSRPGMDCRRCDTTGYDETRVLSLRGGVAARLCSECLTDWSWLVKTGPLSKELLEYDKRGSLLISRENSGTETPKAEVDNYVQESYDLDLKLHELGVKFLKDGIIRHKED